MQCVLRTAPSVVGGPGALVSMPSCSRERLRRHAVDAWGAKCGDCAFCEKSAQFPGWKTFREVGDVAASHGRAYKRRCWPASARPGSLVGSARPTALDQRAYLQGRPSLPSSEPHARLARAIAGRALFPLALSMKTPCSHALLLHHTEGRTIVCLDYLICLALRVNYSQATCRATSYCAAWLADQRRRIGAAGVTFTLIHATICTDTGIAL